jgi:mono/diheme cytochrome c family protein
MSWKSIAVFGFAVGLSAADMDSDAWNKSHLVIGRDLYRENCAVCHDIDKDKAHSRKFGPSLNHLFKNERLPMSRGKPSRQYVVIRIKFGGPVMPAFGKKLNEDEINTLIDYIASK